MGNFCTNCGAKLKEDYNFCINCGTKVDKTDIKQNNHYKSTPDSIEKNETKKELESSETESKLTRLIQEYKIEREKEQKARIAKEKEKKARITKEQKKNIIKIEENKITHGGYCDLGCRHCYEEFLDSGGGITGDFDSEGYVEYYCRLGYSISFGRFCEDYD